MTMTLEAGFAPPDSFADAFDLAHELAARDAGASDFGPDDYRRGLRVLLQSMDYDPVFTEFGRRIAWGMVVRTLAARAAAVRSMAQHPGFDRAPVKAPVVITGIPRTGTTALHKLMALDPQFQGLEGWLIDAPMPRPARETWEAHPLFQAAVARLNARFAATPDMRAAHNMVAEEVDEDLGVLGQSFVSNIWTCAWSSASYDVWWRTQSERPAYQHFRRVLQLIGSAEPQKTWLLKNPGHVANLDLLFETFPDARVIQTHRDPAKAVPSLCGLLAKNHPVMEVGREALWAQLLGVRETEKWAKAVQDAEPVRQAHAGQVLDVAHGDLHRDPLAVVRRIYGFLALELSSDVETAMRARIADDPERSFGEHRYAVGDFGLSEDEIRERFGPYIDRFDLRPTTSALEKEPSR
jgi:hypothetical protein